MIQITDVNSLETLLRTMLITQSELQANFVRNAMSLYGTDLDSKETNDIFAALDQTSEVLILFSLESRDSDADMSESSESSDEHIDYYKSFTCKIIIYGAQSTNTAMKLSSRIRTQNVRTSLQQNGIYVESVSNLNRVQEFKNNVIWLRTDFDIDIRVQFKVLPVTTDSSFLVSNQLNIKNI